MKIKMKSVAAATILALSATSALAGNPTTAKFDVIVKLNNNLSVAGHESNKNNAKNMDL